MPKSKAKKSSPAAARKTKGKPKKSGKADTSGMVLDHDVKIPKSFPLKFKDKPAS